MQDDDVEYPVGHIAWVQFRCKTFCFQAFPKSTDYLKTVGDHRNNGKTRISNANAPLSSMYDVVLKWLVFDT